MGHVRDLPRNAADVPAKYKGEPWARLGVDVDNDFAALYVVTPDRTKQVTRLKTLLKDSDELLLATDEDREGEAIAWHLVETLKPKVPVRRMVFHEITRPAIQAAVANPREIDQSLVDAQEARRILDRLYGYEVSPVLWKKVMPKARRPALSAGRVQSVATRIVVERERERMAFRSAEYWDIKADPGRRARTRSRTGPRTFTATLVALDGDRIATGKDFDPATGAGAGRRGRGAPRRRRRPRAGRPPGGPPVRGHPGRGEAVPAPAVRAVHHLDAAAGGRPQAALLVGADHAHRAAALRERLHHLYAYRLGEPRPRRRSPPPGPQIAELYGDRFVPPQPRTYTGKVKNAQEAHEAIRPAGDVFRTPGEVANELSTEEFKLYELIWRRTIASQMTDAVGIVGLGADPGDLDGERGVRLRRHRQDDHRSRLPQGVRGVLRRRRRRGRRRRAPAAERWPRASR